ncbi:MAG: hypothetical protein HGA67_01300 [Candidatus Yonathbacteria bacterium]|nr:hypothetical protein [Candidatus Yonathbacteria bacterium]
MKIHNEQIPESPQTLEKTPGTPDSPEKLLTYAEGSLHTIETYADNEETIPLQTIEAVNATTNIPGNRLEEIQEESGFSQALKTFKERLGGIKQAARLTLEKILIGTTLSNPATTSPDLFAADAESITPIEMFDTPNTTSTEREPIREATSTPEPTSTPSGVEQPNHTIPETKTNQEHTEPSYVETIGDKAMYESKLAEFRHSAEDATEERTLTVIEKKDGSYLFRETNLSSPAGGYTNIATKEELRESAHVEHIHTHPYGLRVESAVDGGTLIETSHARYMPPSIQDIGGTFALEVDSNIPENRYSERVIDAHGDWTYTADIHHPFFKHLGESGKEFLSEARAQGLELTEEDIAVIKKNRLTPDMVKYTGETYGTHSGIFADSHLNEIATKLVTREKLRKEFIARTAPEVSTLLERVRILSLEIVKFDNRGFGAVSDPTFGTPDGEKAQETRITELCKLYADMGVTMTYTPHETTR